MTATRFIERLPAALELVRYLGCSVVALAVDSSLYALGLRLGLAWHFAACVGFLAGLATAYFLSVRFAFKERSVQNARVEFMIFAAVGLVGLLLTELLLWLQIGVIGTSALVAKGGAAGGVFMFNFLARKALLFSRHARPLRVAA